MTSEHGAVSREPGHLGSFDRWRAVGLVAATVILEAWFLIIVTTPGEKDPRTLAIAAVAVGPLTLLLLLLHPRRAILLTPLLILVPLEFMSVHAFEWIFLLALFAYVLRETPGRPFGFRLGAIEGVFVVYLLWAVLTLPQAENLRVALVGLKTPIIFFLAFLTGSRFLRLPRFPVLLRIYSLIAIGIALETLGVFLIEYHGQGSLTSQLGPSTSLGWGRSNYVSAVASLAAAAGLPAIVLSPGWGRRLAVFAALAAAFVAYATMSRGGTLALVVALILGLAASRLNLRWGVFILVGVVGIFLLSPLGKTVLTGWVASKGLPSIGMRFLYYREALTIIFAHPIFGVGPDQIPYHTYFYMDANPHNVLLKQAADYGFLGLVLYLVLLGLVARRVIAGQRSTTGGWQTLRARSFFLVFFVALINASYEPTLVGPHYGFLFWLMVGTLCASPDEKEAEPA
jgi:O-antigen ligase